MGLDTVFCWAAPAPCGEGEEHITLTPRFFSRTPRPEKAVAEWSFNPYWVRVEMAEPHEHASPLRLWSHGKFLQIGAFLAPDERAKFAQRLKSALRNAREITA